MINIVIDPETGRPVLVDLAGRLLGWRDVLQDDAADEVIEPVARVARVPEHADHPDAIWVIGTCGCPTCDECEQRPIVAVVGSSYPLYAAWSGLPLAYLAGG